MKRALMLSLMLVVVSGSSCHSHDPPEVDQRVDVLWTQVDALTEWAGGDAPVAGTPGGTDVNKILEVAIRNAEALRAVCDYLEAQVAAGNLTDAAGIQAACGPSGPGVTDPPSNKPPPFPPPSQ